MYKFHLFFDANNQAIVVEDNPEALDRAPYEQMVRRHSAKPVDAGLADLALKMHGGVAIYADQEAVTVQAE